MGGMCQIMDSGLRLYGHPDLLAVAASINGDDFVPYNDAIFVKQPGLGGSVSWHQDGVPTGILLSGMKASTASTSSSAVRHLSDELPLGRAGITQGRKD